MRGGGQDKRGEGKLSRRVKCLVLCRNGLLRLTHTPGTREAAVSRSTPASSFLLCLGHQIWAEQESWEKPGELSPRPIPLGSLESRLQQRTSSHCFLSRVWSPSVLSIQATLYSCRPQRVVLQGTAQRLCSPLLPFFVPSLHGLLLNSLLISPFGDRAHLKQCSRS